ncbi:hypothetical protein V1227_09720 [Lentzea sp. DG1S-22]|uniref:hypothetical protein n=1 Tax=Lentzea sp. DG1S-22 TaxID=3108822 RepID=UPI002E7803C1|nr:hypothetical protein [Lentzea sp. DG1S-22]WVH83003.1 hypothetical protein V1227_09720 [Lentzea sp. DG1S-22]
MSDHQRLESCSPMSAVRSNRWPRQPSRLVRSSTSLLRRADGPSEESLHTGQAVRCPDLGVLPSRWPRSTSAALELGFVAVGTVPMRLKGEADGSLNLFRTSSGA